MTISVCWDIRTLSDCSFFSSVSASCLVRWPGMRWDRADSPCPHSHTYGTCPTWTGSVCQLDFSFYDNRLIDWSRSLLFVTRLVTCLHNLEAVTLFIVALIFAVHLLLYPNRIKCNFRMDAWVWTNSASPPTWLICTRLVSFFFLFDSDFDSHSKPFFICFIVCFW